MTMQQKRDEVLHFQELYFDYIEGITDDPPTTNALSDEERAQVESWLRSLEDARGVNPYASRPSLETLLTTGEAILQRDALANRLHQRADGRIDELAVELGNQLRNAFTDAIVVRRDVAGLASGLVSELLVTCRGVRLRVIHTPDFVDIDTYFVTHIAELSSVFGAFPDIQAVVIVTPVDNLAVIVEQDDIVEAIETPSGHQSVPRLRRPIADTSMTFVQYINEQVPTFDTFDAESLSPDPLVITNFDPSSIVRDAVLETAAAGRRAQVPAKKSAWGGLAEREIDAIAELIRRSLATELTSDQYRQELNALVADAA